MSQIKLLPQEVQGDSKFTGQLVMTCGFKAAFGEAAVIAMITLLRIINERVKGDGADYLQKAEYKGVRYWIIDDGEVVTVLLPSEY